MNDLSLYKNCSSDNIDALIKEYVPNVKRIVYHMLGRLPNNVDVDDLIQAGMMGLLDAAKQYDASKGASFDTYAGIRIRGAILDDVRKNDWYPRSVYKNTREITEAIKKVENFKHRDARPNEIAEAMNLSLDEYHTLLREVNSGQIYNFDDLGLTQDSFLTDSQNSTNPLLGVEGENYFIHISEVIEKIPEKEQLVLSLYYNDELNLKEIGQVLGISESRVCQIRSQALLRVKSRLEKEDE